MRAVVLVVVAVCLAAVVFLETAEGTKLALAAALPVVASVGGLAALKVLKYVGLSKLKSGWASGLGSLGSGSLGSLGSLGSVSDLADSGYDSYQNPYYTQPLYQAGGYQAGGYQAGGPPAFYIVPASHFDDYRRRGRRDIQSVTEGVVEVRDGEYWGVVEGLDRDGCARMLVCELAKVPSSKLNQDGHLIMSVFSSAQSRSELDLQTAQGMFAQAYWLGKGTTDTSVPSDICSRVYSNCQESPDKLLKELSQVQIQ